MYFEEGDKCPIKDCNGLLEFRMTEPCTCHLGHPPCSACINQTLFCQNCGFDIEEESDEESKERQTLFYEPYPSRKKCRFCGETIILKQICDCGNPLL